MQTTILIVDDEPSQRRSLEFLISERLGYRPLVASSGEEALKILFSSPSPAPDLMLLDINMPGLNGLDVLKKAHSRIPELPILMLTAQSDVGTVVEAMKAGAYDFLTKPIEPERIHVSIENALKFKNLSTEMEKMRRDSQGLLAFSDLIGTSSAMRQTVELGLRAAGSHIPVLIEGESGVGKEMFARAIHGSGARQSKPFVAVNCGAIPENLVESTLFGHEKGSFTGAMFKSAGKFREAHGGTLFLDEVGELKPDIQVKLLRALQEGEIEPVGAPAPVKVDIRVISATNRDLGEMVRTGAFREDLYYRLHVFPLRIPPLRERKDDLAQLISYFCKRFSALESKQVKSIHPDAMTLLEAYHWPGNIRQLENIIFRAVVLAQSQQIEVCDLPSIVNPNASTEGRNFGAGNVIGFSQLIPLDEQGHFKSLEEIETEVIRLAIEHYQGHMSEVARRLGIGRSTLYRKLGETDVAVGS